MKALSLLLVLFPTFLLADDYYHYRSGGVRYETRGNFSQRQLYSTQGTYLHQPHSRTSRYRNTWEVKRQYELDDEGIPVAGGYMATEGVAERNYIHNNEPAQMKKIARKESSIMEMHRSFIPDIQACYGSIAESKMRIEEIRRSRPTPGSEEEIRRLEWGIEADQSTIRLMKKWNSERMQGKW